MRGPQHGGTSGPYGGKPEARSIGSVLGSGGKLDARFVQDVTIFDGTELAPGTQFTKIWRLRNSGSIAWPPQTQLVHVGGDELGSVYAVTLEVILCKILMILFLFCLSLACAIDWNLENNLEIYVLQG
jgi:next-to-BRCA1 protein 1